MILDAVGIQELTTEKIMTILKHFSAKKLTFMVKAYYTCMETHIIVIIIPNLLIAIEFQSLDPFSE